MRYTHVFEKDALAVRSEGRTQCPFCGSDAIVSWHDVSADPGRVELYCDNGNCDVREMAVIALRVGGWNPRADVLALEAVDRGTRPEQEEFGTDPARYLSPEDLGEAMRFSIEHGDHRLRNRIRPTRVTVEIAPDWATGAGNTPPLDDVDD